MLYSLELRALRNLIVAGSLGIAAGAESNFYSGLVELVQIYTDIGSITGCAGISTPAGAVGGGDSRSVTESKIVIISRIACREITSIAQAP